MPGVFANFDYMVWAKARSAGVPFHLGASGLAPPPPELLAQDLSLDLAQRGADMPPRARALVAARFGLTAEQVMLTQGTSHAVYLACRILLGPGDCALVERPAYEVLRTLPALCGAEVERIERRREDRWRLPADLPERIRALRPRLTIVTNPHNPTGALLSLAELAPAAAAVAEVGGVLLSDEVYLEYLPDAPARSALALGPHVLACGSLTKAYGLGTVRFGWLLGQAALIERAIRYNDYIGVLYPSPAAAVGVRAFERLDALSDRAVQARRDGLPIFQEWLAQRPELRCHLPEAGVTALVELPASVGDTFAFCDRLEREHGTVVVPGDFFEAPGSVRIGFGIPEAMLRAGLERLGAAITAAGASTG